MMKFSIETVVNNMKIDEEHKYGDYVSVVGDEVILGFNADGTACCAQGVTKEVHKGIADHDAVQARIQELVNTTPVALTEGLPGDWSEATDKVWHCYTGDLTVYAAKREDIFFVEVSYEGAHVESQGDTYAEAMGHIKVLAKQILAREIHEDVE